MQARERAQIGPTQMPSGLGRDEAQQGRNIRGEPVLDEDAESVPDRLAEVPEGKSDWGSNPVTAAARLRNRFNNKEAMPSGTFLDAATMKAKLRQSIVERPAYNVHDYYKEQGFCQMVARSNRFEKCTLLVIAFNALWLAIDTDMNPAAVVLDAPPTFQIAEHGFCMYFAGEWVIRFCAFRQKKSGLWDAWFVFDYIMVIMMVGETWVMSIIMLIVGGGSLSGGNVGTVRLLRLLRLSRMARMAKLLRSFPELMILIKGVASAMRSVVVTIVMLFGLMYVFAIAFRTLTAGSAVEEPYFTNVCVAVNTLWMDGALLDGTGTLVSILLEENVGLVILFYSFVLLAALSVMNMLIGVICEVVSAISATEKEQIMVATVKDGFMEIIKKGDLDMDGDGQISRSEFERILQSPDTIRLLEKLDVDVYGFIDLADFIFETEDGEDPVQMSFGDFMETVLSLRGSNTTTVKDIVDLRKFIKSQFIFQRQESRRPLVTPMPPPSKSGRRHWWMQIAELEAVLAGVQARLERFVDTIPSVCSSTGLKRAQSNAWDSGASASSVRAAAAGGHTAHTTVNAGHTAGGPAGSILASDAQGRCCAPFGLAANPPPWDGNFPLLPGQVSDLPPGAAGRGEAAPRCRSADSRFAASDADSRARAKAGLSQKHPTLLPNKIAELRLQLQRLRPCLGASIEDLQGVQELL